MSDTSYDLVAIGNAIIDVLAQVDEQFLKQHGLEPGTMALIDGARAEQLYSAIEKPTQCSGGSAANTLAGYGMLGGSAAFFGKVADDDAGRLFTRDMADIGVHHPSRPAYDMATARSMVFVTQDGDRVERTMATYLGASVTLSGVDIDEDIIARTKVLFFEGYLWDSDTARPAIRRAIEVAHEAGVRVAFTLSDRLCVERHRADFLDLVHNHVDIFFCNEREIEALYEDADIRSVMRTLSQECSEHRLGIAAVTRSELGSYILQRGQLHHVDADAVERVYDVTGAGDLYAAGFLYGCIQGWSSPECGHLGALCASEVIKYLGARPINGLKHLV